MSKNQQCPCCEGTATEALYPSYSGTCVTSDMEILEAASIDNRLCKTCGLIFNATGTRGQTEDFYANSYKLMMRQGAAKIQSFASGKRPVTQAERTFDILKELVDVPVTGTVLEAGAGKGEFLGYFVEEFSEWQVKAFEPSMSFDVLQSSFPSAEVFRSGYQGVEIQGSADLVVALGVLEHVDNPLDMMRWAARQLSDGGIFYVRVPNFANNPNDLFCADHLSKLTVPTLSSLAQAAGFEVLGHKEAGVPVFIVLRKTGADGPVPNAFEKNATVARANVGVAEGAIEAVNRCRSTAQKNGEAFAIFGLGSSGLFAPFLSNFEADEIAAYLDENQSVWGSVIHGRPVGGLDLVDELNIKHVALAISPAYFEQVRAKLLPLGVEVYSA